MIDSYGRNINYLRVSITERCNLRCIYCMPEKSIGQSSLVDHLKQEEILEIIKTASLLGIHKIRFTGGEPLLYNELEELIYETSRLSGIHNIGITTNGTFLYDRIHQLKKSGLNRVNISLDTLNKEQYRRITRGGELQNVLQGIETCLSLGLQSVKLNTVLLRGINDHEVWDFMELTRDLPIEIRFIELMPFGEGANLYHDCSVTVDTIRNSYPQLIPVGTEKGSTARLYKLAGAKGKIGFIHPMSNQFCSDCNKIRLTSSGTIKPCLHSQEEINIRDKISDQAALKAAIGDAIYHKPSRHWMNEEKSSRSLRLMHQVGG